MTFIEFISGFDWYVYILLGTLFGSISFIVRKKVLQHEHALEYTSFRCIITFILFFILSFFISLKISMFHLIIIFLTAFISSTGLIFRNKAVRHGDISSVAPLGGVTNIFVLVWGILFLSEFPDLNHFFGIILCFLGIFLIEFNKKFKFKKLFGKKFIKQYLFAMLLFSIDAVILRYLLLQGLSPFTALFYLWLFITIFIILKELQDHGLKDLKHFKKDFFLIFWTTFFMFIRNILFLFGLSFPAAQIVLAKTVDNSSSIFITFIGGRFFHEKQLIRKSVAALIILIGSLMIIL